MKILHCLSQLPQKTGSGVYFSNLVREFDSLGVENVLFYATEEPYKNDFGSQKTYSIEYNTKDLPFAIPGMSDEMPYKSSVFSEMTDDTIKIYRNKLQDELYKIKETEKPDLIISHHLFMMTDLICEIFDDTKVLAICHGTDLRQINMHPKFLKYLTNIYMVDKFLTVSKKDIEMIKEIFNIADEKITRVGGAYNPLIFNENYEILPRTNQVIVYAGKISQSKGIFELVKALPLINEVYPNAEIHIIGNASESDKFELITNAGDSEKRNLKIYNAENQKKMAEHLKQADIFVLPSYYEALGLCAIEALACNKRVVASEIEGLITELGETVNNSGIIEYVEKPRIHDVDKAVEEDKAAYVKRLAKSIILQLDRISENEEVSDNIKSKIKESSWTNLARRIFAEFC